MARRAGLQGWFIRVWPRNSVAARARWCEFSGPQLPANLAVSKARCDCNFDLSSVDLRPGIISGASAPEQIHVLGDGPEP